MNVFDLEETTNVIDLTQNNRLSSFDLNEDEDDISVQGELSTIEEGIEKSVNEQEKWESTDEDDDDYQLNTSELSSGKESGKDESNSEINTSDTFLVTSPSSYVKKPLQTLDFLDELHSTDPVPFESPLGGHQRDSYLNDLRQSLSNDASPISHKQLSPEISEVSLKYNKYKKRNDDMSSNKYKKQKKPRKKKFKLEDPTPEEVTNVPDIENFPPCDVLVLFDIDNCSGLFFQLLDACFDKKLIVLVFGGPVLPKVPMHKLNYMAQMIAQQRLFVIMTPKSHKNSADFCLSFYAGICHNKIETRVPFIIVSSDNAFEETAHQLRVSEPRRQTYIFGAGSQLNAELRVMCNLPPSEEKPSEPQPRSSNKKNAKQRRIEARSKKVFKPMTEENTPSPINSPKPSVNISFGPL